MSEPEPQQNPTSSQTFASQRTRRDQKMPSKTLTTTRRTRNNIHLANHAQIPINPRNTSPDPQPANNPDQESNKQKTKVTDFDDDSSVPSFILDRPSSYALQKLEDIEYVKLCFTKMGDLVALRPISSTRASRNVIQDENLTMAQLSVARTAFLDHAKKLAWPRRHLDSLVRFFSHIENHPLRRTPHGEEALLAYQAQVRREWHD
ncbi:hypothetical protein SERLADRAFT_440657 [Serpula lacrymans var. lacrymans S7.9]|uniref:Uncharacterized protein n=1 Tax=Serpula lacrymans var. lacrymans (strain S7.9) TaxID=578457 RepID=F8P3A7_SERL9|nr:uncharacterized protein SERLADRAFT_440657 [Serpula lacrymans var. lacrymans S7.9]EGO22638.1 hypothetical protein SERLADRAFT_440657 [Serpula lacrymans var. lacrymans S7.9]